MSAALAVRSNQFTYGHIDYGHAAHHSGSEVLINKPTIIDGEWHEIPTVVRLQDGRIVSERMPFIEQAREVAMLLAVLVMMAPGIFIAADWLRYGGV